MKPLPLLLLTLCAAAAYAEYEYRYIEAEGYLATEGGGLREEGFTSWMRHPSNGQVMVLSPSGWLEYEVEGLGEGPYDVFVRGLAWAAGCEVDVYWDGEKIGRPAYPTPGTALKWSGVVGQVAGPGSHRLRIVADAGITQAPYIDTVLLTNQQGYRPADEDCDFVSYKTQLPLLSLGEEEEAPTVPPEPSVASAPSPNLQVLSVRLSTLGLGRNDCALTFRNSGARAMEVTAAATFGEAAPGPMTLKVGPGLEALCHLGCEARVAGETLLRLSLSAGESHLVTGAYKVTVPEPVAIDLDHYAYPLGTEQAIWTATFTADAQVVRELSLSAELQQEDGTALQTQEATGSGEALQRAFDISALPEGRYRMSSVVRRGETVVHSDLRELQVYTPEPLEQWVAVEKTEARGDTLLLNGRPFLGKLLYHAAPDETTREHGFNLVQCYGSDPDPLDGIQRHLDGCVEAQVWGAVALFNNKFFLPGDHFDLDHLRLAVERFRDHPALWGWDLIDEPEVSVPPEAVARAARLIRELDQDHIVWVNLCRSPRALDYLESQDLWSFDFYPVPGLPVFSYMQWLAISDEHFRGKRPIGSVMQTYAYPGGRMPTPDELNAMTFLHIIHGYKWLGFYSYHDAEPAGCLARSPVLLSSTASLTGRLRALEAVILGDAPYVPVAADAAPEVFQAATKVHGDKTYLFAVSGTTEPMAVEMKVEGTRAEALFENGRSVPIEDGTLRDGFRGHGVHIYTVH